jgi:hypothetical protein
MEAAVNRHRPFKIFAPFALILLIGACQGTDEVRAVASLAIACDTYASVLDQLTPLRAQGKLSEGDISRVDTANAVAARACSPDSSLDPSHAVTVVKEVNAQLQALLGGN